MSAVSLNVVICNFANACLGQVTCVRSAKRIISCCEQYVVIFCVEIFCLCSTRINRSVGLRACAL